MLQQVKEFIAWGLSNIAVRNIIIFFFIVCLSSIVGMAGVIASLHQKLDDARTREIKCKEEARELVDSIRREQIKALEVAVERQKQIEEKLLTIQKSKKR